MTPELIAFLGQFGLPLTMLVVVLTAGARGTWRWGREVVAAELRADKAESAAKEWQAIALKAMQAGEKVLTVATNGH